MKRASYNELYDAMRVENNFRYSDDFTCEGSFSTTAVATAIPVSHPESGLALDLSQFPGATQAYLYIRRVSFTNNITTAGNYAAITIDFAGVTQSLTGLCIYDTRDNGVMFNIDKIIKEPITQNFPVINGVSSIGYFQNVLNASSGAAGTVYYQIYGSIAYQITSLNLYEFIEERLAGLDRIEQMLIELRGVQP